LKTRSSRASKRSPRKSVEYRPPEQRFGQPSLVLRGRTLGFDGTRAVTDQNASGKR
jgi:hypothetical protein